MFSLAMDHRKSMEVRTWSNWSGHLQCQPRELLKPASEAELAEIIRNANPVVRVTGSGHSFSPIVPTTDTLISLESLAGIRSIENSTCQFTCGGGTTIHQLGELLHRHNLALANQGDVDTQTIAGAFSTGTHGTGAKFGCLASDLVSFRLITAAGEILACDKSHNSELFHAGAVSLGALGVLSEVTVQGIPGIALVEQIRLMQLEDCLDQVQTLTNDNRHFEFFQFPYADRVLVKTTNLIDAAQLKNSVGSATNDQSEDRLFRWAVNFARIFPALNPWLQRTAMRWYPGRTRSGISSHIFPSARTVRFNEMEYEVPAERGVACYREVLEAVRRHRMTVYFPLEFRRVRGDSLWLSPFFERDSVSISVHQHFQDPFAPLFDLVEPVFWKYAGRPHWGKLHTLSATQLQPLYPRWRDFRAIREQLDPQGKFLNDHLRQVLAED